MKLNKKSYTLFLRAFGILQIFNLSFILLVQSTTSQAQNLGELHTIQNNLNQNLNIANENLRKAQIKKNKACSQQKNNAGCARAKNELLQAEIKKKNIQKKYDEVVTKINNKNTSLGSNSSTQQAGNTDTDAFAPALIKNTTSSSAPQAAAPQAAAPQAAAPQAAAPQAAAPQAAAPQAAAPQTAATPASTPAAPQAPAAAPAEGAAPETAAPEAAPAQTNSGTPTSNTATTLALQELEKLDHLTPEQKAEAINELKNADSAEAQDKILEAAKGINTNGSEKETIAKATAEAEKTAEGREEKLTKADEKYAETKGQHEHRKAVASEYGAKKENTITTGSSWEDRLVKKEHPCGVGSQIDKKYGKCKLTENTAIAGQAANMVATGGGSIAVNAHAQKGQQNLQQSNGGGQAAAFDNVADTAEFGAKVQGIKGIMNLGLAAMQWTNFAKHRKNAKELNKGTEKGEEHLKDRNGSPKNSIEENGEVEFTGLKEGKSKKEGDVAGKIVKNYQLNSDYTVSKDCSGILDQAEKQLCLQQRAEQYLGKAKGIGNDVKTIGAKAAEEQEAAKKMALGSAMQHTTQAAVDVIGMITAKKHAKNMRDAANQFREIDNNTPDDIFIQDPVAEPEPEIETTNRTNDPITPDSRSLADEELGEDDMSELGAPPPAGSVAGGLPEYEGPNLTPGAPVDASRGAGGGAGGGFGFGGVQSTGAAQESGEARTDPSYADTRSKNSSYSASSSGGKRTSGGGGGSNVKAKGDPNPFEQMLAQIMGKNEEKKGDEEGILAFPGRQLASEGEEESLLGKHVDLFERVSRAYAGKVRSGNFAKR